jgi:hypothetical protein
MKFNKWTAGLVAVGAVSLASVAQADEKPSPLMTAVSSTVLSGYVDTSAQWNPGTGNANVPNYAYNSTGKADGFNLDAVKVTLEKPLDESQWAAGYKLDLFFGPDANTLGTASTGVKTSDFTIKQAYVSVRTPIAGTTGIDWKLGVWDTIIGYESTESPNNPNYTRSYGYTLEPTTHTGLQGTYKAADFLSLTAAIANTTGPTIGGFGTAASNPGRANPPKAESYKTYMGSATLTAPNDWGFVAGSSLSAGVINGFNTGLSGGAGTQTSIYAGATLSTPVTGLKAGISYDYLGIQHQNYGLPPTAATDVAERWANDVALYATFQATEKLSFDARGEYLWQSKVPAAIAPINGPSKILALTGTVQYDLWKNVLSRLEFRWDHQAGSIGNATGEAYGGDVNNFGLPDKHNSYLFAANIIYKF